MTKRKIKVKKSEISAKKPKRGSDSDNPLAEVLIKNHDKSSSDSSASKSDSSSSDDSYYLKKRAAKKRKKHRSDNKLRKLQDQMDLFQRNVDIKLNFLESLVQTLVKNQASGSSQRIQAPQTQKYADQCGDGEKGRSSSFDNDDTKNLSSMSDSVPMCNSLPLTPNNVFDGGLGNEMRGYMKQIICEVDAANAKEEARFENLTAKFNVVQKEITNLCSEFRGESSSCNVFVADNQERTTHVKISNSQQFFEMEERLESSESAELHKQLASIIIPRLNPKMGFVKRENSYVASLLKNYFEASFLNTLGWTEKVGGINLNNKTGHLSLFSSILNRACPGKFGTSAWLNSSFSLVLRRFREQLSRLSKPADNGNNVKHRPMQTVRRSRR